MKKLLMIVIVLTSFALMSNSGCEKTSDDTQRIQQEKILGEGTSAVGMPAIKNFRERRILKDILELRDQEGLVTYTYIFSEITGKYTYLGETIGYGIPYATQFTNPMKSNGSYGPLPQADPNTLFSPSSAEGTWIMMYDPVNKKTSPQYIESRVSVFSFKLRASLVIAGYEDEPRK